LLRKPHKELRGEGAKEGPKESRYVVMIDLTAIQSEGPRQFINDDLKNMEDGKLLLSHMLSGLAKKPALYFAKWNTSNCRPWTGISA
jgi:hypothetical protein